MLDPKKTHRGALIQRGATVAAREEEHLPLVERPTNLLRHYLLRKERRQQVELERFQEGRPV